MMKTVISNRVTWVKWQELGGISGMKFGRVFYLFLINLFIAEREKKRMKWKERWKTNKYNKINLNLLVPGQGWLTASPMGSS